MGVVRIYCRFYRYSIIEYGKIRFQALYCGGIGKAPAPESDEEAVQAILRPAFYLLLPEGILR